MAGLKTLLGLYPKTTDYEEKRIQLQKEFDELNEFTNSEELARYKELEEIVTSEAFKHKQNELLGLKYKGSEEYLKEKELQQLQKSKDVKLYHKTSVSEELAIYNKYHNSDELKKLTELEAFVKSDDFLKVKTHYKLSAKKRFVSSDLGHTLKQYQEQSKSEEIVGYFKFVGHKLYPNFEKLKDSDTLKKYEELKTLVESHEFASKKHALSKDEFAASEEGAKYQEYKELAKTAEIVNFEKAEKLPQKKYYDSLHGSDQLNAYDELEKFILSHDFKEQKKAITDKSFHDTEEYKKLRELEQLKKDGNIKTYFKFAKSKEFANYSKLKDSDKLKRLAELEAYVKSDEFLAKKGYLMLKPKERWSKSDEFVQLEEYNRLKSSEKFKWYFKAFGDKKFDWIKAWNMTFQDEFNSGKLDRDKWLTRYYYGEEMIQNSYSLQEEKHYISDGNNLDFGGTHLKIITRKEMKEGLGWHKDLGFIPRKFDYSSGLINSGKSFRQKYGLFEAKIKFAKTPELLNAFWMVGDEQMPHIDVVKANGKCSVGIQTDKASFKKSLKRSKFSGQYYIYSMEWTAEKIIWRINGLEVASTNRDVPQSEMYVVLSAGLFKDLKNDGSQPVMEVDWIRCYEKAKAE